MKTALTTLSVLALSAALCGQGLQTATNYLVFANAGQGDLAGVGAGTAVPRTGLAVRATDRDPATAAAAAASTLVDLSSPSTSPGGLVTVAESGNAFVRGSGRAGGGTAIARPPVPAPHALAWGIQAPQGTTAVVVVSWDAHASANASTAVGVDVDGDGQPDFAARVSGGRVQQQQTFRVTAGLRGFHLGIVTSGAVATNGGAESYDAKLGVGLRLGGMPTCTFTAFGPECGGTLAGQAASTPRGAAVQIDLTGAQANAIAALVLGDPVRPAITLPGSRCQVLVAPRVLVPGRTDGTGAASWMFPLRIGTQGSISFQAVTVGFGGGSAQLASSNALTLTCQ